MIVTNGLLRHRGYIGDRRLRPLRRRRQRRLKRIRGVGLPLEERAVVVVIGTRVLGGVGIGCIYRGGGGKVVGVGVEVEVGVIMGIRGCIPLSSLLLSRTTYIYTTPWATNAETGG